MAETRARAWRFLLWQENIDKPFFVENGYKDWKDYLDQLGLEYIISPFHDKDTLPDGSQKKPHYHGIFVFDGKKSFSQIKEILSPFETAIPLVCDNVGGAIRYMCHVDNPEKYQYPIGDIICHGSFNIFDFFRPSQSEQQQIFRDIITLCREKHISEFSELIDFLHKYNEQDWEYVATRTMTIPIVNYLKSFHFKRKEQIEKDHQNLVEQYNQLWIKYREVTGEAKSE